MAVVSAMALRWHILCDWVCSGLEADDFLELKIVVQFGYPPMRIDLIGLTATRESERMVCRRSVLSSRRWDVRDRPPAENRVRTAFGHGGML